MPRVEGQVVGLDGLIVLLTVVGRRNARGLDQHAMARADLDGAAPGNACAQEVDQFQGRKVMKTVAHIAPQTFLRSGCRELARGQDVQGSRASSTKSEMSRTRVGSSVKASMPLIVRCQSFKADLKFTLTRHWRRIKSTACPWFRC
jgi:hypothetical protein